MTRPLASVILLLAASVGCLAEPCANNVVRRVVSPNGELEAVLYGRDCGATTAFSTQVAVVPTGEPLPKDPDAVFVADGDGGKAPAARWGGPPAQAEWREGDRLVVRYAVEARVFRQRASVEVTTRAGERRLVWVAYERAL